MITLIGTAHILPINKYLYEQLDDIQPNVICVELDQQRYQSINKLLNHKNEWKHKTDMPSAIAYANQKGIPLELIDKPITEKESKLLSHHPFKRKIHSRCRKILFFLLIFSFPWLSIQIMGRKMISNINTFLHQPKKLPNLIDEFNDPEFYHFIIEMRNEIMANKLMMVSKEYDKIVAIVGDSHVEGISKILEKNGIHFSAIHLQEYYEDNVRFQDLFPKNERLIVQDLLFLLFILLVGAILFL